MTFLTWLAHSPLASFCKVFAAGGLGWVLINFQTLRTSPRYSPWTSGRSTNSY
jgi:hypothetical protein